MSASERISETRESIEMNRMTAHSSHSLDDQMTANNSHSLDVDSMVLSPIAEARKSTMASERGTISKSFTAGARSGDGRSTHVFKGTRTKRLNVVTDDEVTAMYKQSRQWAHYTNFVLYGILNTDRDEGIKVEVSPWRFRMWLIFAVIAATINVIGNIMRFSGPNETTLRIVSAGMRIVSGVSNIVYIIYAMDFGAKMEDSCHVAKAQKRIITSTLNNSVKKRLMFYMRNIQIFSLLLFIPTTILAFGLTDSNTYLALQPDYEHPELLRLGGVLYSFYYVYQALCFHQSCTWSWLV